MDIDSIPRKNWSKSMETYRIVYVSYGLCHGFPGRKWRKSVWAGI